ncbi:MAG TPA: ubiquinol-cytochrome C chaperone family protein [Caulobacteraceae bacterium]|nr:ubiquinol-cytochrome C chaperone family protein [Caulobacteraceae bacterium]
MGLRTLFRTRPAVEAGRALLTQAAAQARQPAFYADWGAPDTREGRFELLVLHVVLLARRLKGHGEQATETAQALIDACFGSLDVALREMGTGDLSMSKKMKTLGQAFFGRAKAYGEALDALPRTERLEEFIGRALLADDGAAQPFVRYVIAAEQGLAGQSLDDLLVGKAAWPTVRA